MSVPTLPPRENLDLIGHERIEADLAAAIKAGRLPHALLLAGPVGIGKATLAYRLARYLLLQPNPQSNQTGLFGAPPAGEQQAECDRLSVDGDGPHSQQIAAGSHPDLQVLERGFNVKTKRMRSEIVVDDVRKVSHFFNLTPAYGGWRIAIVDCADEMNRNAANAILKLLEEPPANTALILVSHAPGRLLPTIRSRCHRVRMSPLSEPEMRRWLDGRNDPVDVNRLERVLALAEGSPGRAEALLDGNGLAALDDLLGLLASAPRLDIKRLHQVTDIWCKPAKEGETDAFASAVSMLDWWTARAIRIAATGTGSPADGPEAQALGNIVTRIGIAAALDRRDRALALLARGDGLNLDRRQLLLDALLALAA